MANIEIKAEEFDLMSNTLGFERGAGSVARILHKDGDPDIVALSDLPDGGTIGYLFVFHPKNPTATIYRIRPDAIAGITESGGILVWDNEGEDFPMRRLADISPSYEPQSLLIQNGKKSSLVEFSVENLNR